MKKLSLLLLAVLALCSKTAYAQDSKGSINFVPYVGVNYSDFSGDVSHFFGKTSGKVNFMAGGRFEFQLAPKSALLVDYNYRRLGAMTDYLTKYYSNSVLQPGEVFVPGDEKLYKCYLYRFDYTKVTLDCHTLGLQFKQNITDGFSARVGIEASCSAAEYWHSDVFEKITEKKGFVNEHIDYYGPDRDKIEKDGWEYVSYGKDDIDGMFKDHLFVAIPLGVTYDYKNFSINATYHLPLSKCSEDKDEQGNTKALRNQAFDLTIGYRLPLRKK